MDLTYGESKLIDGRLPLSKVYHDATLYGDGTQSKPLRVLATTPDTVLTSAPATNLTATGITTTFTANEAQAFGDAVFINSSGKAQLGDATVIATSSCIAMSLGTVSTDEEGSYLMYGFIRNDAWNWTVGQPVYLSVTGTTGNTLTQTAPVATDEVVQILGIATHADRLFFNPQLVQVENL